MITRSCRLGLVGALALLAAGVSSRPGVRAQAGSDPVGISFLSIGRDGRPILDLKPEEVQLRVDGRPRTITSLDVIKAQAAGGAATPARAVLPPPFGTNAGATSKATSTTYLAIDDKSFRPGNDRLMKQAIDRFLAALPPTSASRSRRRHSQP
jgi:hypothetical protein